jgi:O-antigen ligase
MTAEPVTATPLATDAVPPVDDGPSRERTPWLLGILCVVIPVLPAFSVPAGPLKSNGSPAKLIAIVLFGLAVLGYFVVVRRSTTTRTIRPGVVIILLYVSMQLLIYGVGLTTEGSPLVEASKTRSLINLVANVGVALYVFAHVRSTRQRDFVLACLAIGLAFACFVGLLQALANVDLRFLFEPPGFVRNTDALDMGERWGAKRIMGTSQHAIEFSVLAVITFVLMLYFARHATKPLARWAAGVACAGALAAMPATVSRTGVIALATALMVFVWSVKIRHLAVGVVVAAVAAGAYMLALPNISTALWNTIVNSEDDPSIIHRTTDYTQVSETFHAHPIFGLGLGASPPTEYGYLDNQWLQAIVQGGIIGVTALMVLTAAGIFGIAAALRVASTRRERDQAYTVGAMVFAIIMCSTTFDLFAFEQASRILFLLIALLWCNFSIPVGAASATSTNRAAT